MKVSLRQGEDSWDFPIIAVSTVLLFLLANSSSEFMKSFLIASPLLFFYPGYILLSLISYPNQIQSYVSYGFKLIYSFLLSTIILLVLLVLSIIFLNYSTFYNIFNLRILIYGQTLIIIFFILLLYLKEVLKRKETNEKDLNFKRKIEASQQSFLHPFIPPRLKESLKKIEKKIDQPVEKNKDRKNNN